MSKNIPVDNIRFVRKTYKRVRAVKRFKRMIFKRILHGNYPSAFQLGERYQPKKEDAFARLAVIEQSINEQKN